MVLACVGRSCKYNLFNLILIYSILWYMMILYYIIYIYIILLYILYMSQYIFWILDIIILNSIMYQNIFISTPSCFGCKSNQSSPEARMWAWDLMVPPMSIRSWTRTMARSWGWPCDGSRREKSAAGCVTWRSSPTLSINGLCFTGRDSCQNPTSGSSCWFLQYIILFYSI